MRPKRLHLQQVVRAIGIERHDHQRLSRRKHELFRKVKVDTAADPPLGQIQGSSRGVGHFHELQIGRSQFRIDCQGRFGWFRGMIHHLGDKHRSHPRALVPTPQSGLDERRQKSGPVGHPPERFPAARTAKVNVVNQSYRSSIRIGA